MAVRAERVLSLFSGVGGLDLGYRIARPSSRVVCYVEREAFAASILVKAMEGGWLDKAPVFSDVAAFDARRWRGVVDTVIGGFPCFAPGTLVLTWDGFLPIESLAVGDRVLTHLGRWRRVTSVMCRQADSTVVVRGQGFPDITTTHEHPFYVRRRGYAWNNSIRQDVRTFGSPGWVDASELAGGFYAGQCLPPVAPPGEIPGDVDFWWLVGRYLACGWLGESNGKGRVVISANDDKSPEVESRIKRVFHCSKSVERTCNKFHISRQAFHDFLLEFGRYAHGKRIPGWVLGLDPERAEALLAGYLHGDGSPILGKNKQPIGERATTVSRALALGLALVS